MFLCEVLYCFMHSYKNIICKLLTDVKMSVESVVKIQMCLKSCNRLNMPQTVSAHQTRTTFLYRHLIFCTCHSRVESHFSMTPSSSCTLEHGRASLSNNMSTGSLSGQVNRSWSSFLLCNILPDSDCPLPSSQLQSSETLCPKVPYYSRIK